jgi:NTE family protein/lysophospholipid hydrolase
MLIEYGRGEFIGLAGLMSEELCPGEGYAIRDSILLRITKPNFVRLLMKHEELINWHSRRIVNTYRRLLGFTPQTCSPLHFSVSPLTDDPGIQESQAALLEALSRFGQGTLLQRKHLDKILGEGASRSESDFMHQKLMTWIQEQEAMNRFVLYGADSTDTAWTKWCLRQADCVLLAARAESKPDLQRLNAMFANRLVGDVPIQLELLLIHDADTELPSNTRAWMEIQGVNRHHHVRRNNDADFQRVARRLTNRGVGVVLGGGGARGIAHVGVLQAIEEANIPVDYIGGTSMGSLFAAAYARGWSPAQIMAKVEEVFSKPRALIDMTLPYVSLLGGGKLDRVLKWLFGDIEIEDLWLNYFCISSNLIQAEMMVHQRGSLWKSVRASVSLPGIFPPVPMEDQVLVDGGVVNNLPMDIMSDWCKGGPVIAVDASGGGSCTINLEDRTELSGWRMLGSQLKTLGKPSQVPNLFQLLTAATMLSSKHYLQQLLALKKTDLYLTPPLQDHQLLDFNAYRELYDIGYRYAKERLAEWVLPGRTES